MLLAPTVNTHRHPLAGRNFECYSEDPHLTARAAVAYITGVQSQNVGCSVKHFVANDSEFERMSILSEVDASTLREISLPPFEAAVREAGAWSVMSAYNRLNGHYCSEQPWLLGTLLKQEWEFEGLVMSDWYGTHSTAPAANAGLDLEMPGPPAWFGPKARASGARGEVDEKRLDDMVRACSRSSNGRRAGRSGGPAGSVLDDPVDRDVAAPRRAASSCCRTGLRAPLERVATLAVVGPNADIAHVMGGGSARGADAPADLPVGRVALASATTSRSCTNAVARTTRSRRRSTRFIDGPLTIEYYAGREREGEPVLVEEAQRGYFTWMGPVGAGVPDDFSVRLHATLAPTESARGP